MNEEKIEPTAEPAAETQPVEAPENTAAPDAAAAAAEETQDTPDVSDTETDEPLTRRERKALTAELKKLRAENGALNEKLTAAEAAAAEQKDKYLRTLAEYDNYRKRSAKEREGIYADAASDCVKNLLPLFDNLERAAQFTEGGQAAEGVRMILASVPDVLAKLNITAFGAPGDTFDPGIHNAVMHVEDDGHGEGEILEVFQPGYRRGDKIIRYAMVKVAN